MNYQLCGSGWQNNQYWYIVDKEEAVPAVGDLVTLTINKKDFEMRCTRVEQKDYMQVSNPYKVWQIWLNHKKS